MIVSAVILVLVVGCFFILNHANNFTRTISMYFLVISVNIIVGTIYLAKTSSVTLQFGLDYRIFFFIHGIKLPMNTIVRIFNGAFALYMLVAVQFGKTLHKLRWWQMLLLTLPCLYFFTYNDPVVSQNLHIAYYTLTGNKHYILEQFMFFNEWFNQAILIFYMILPEIMLFFYCRKTVIFVKWKDALVAGICILIVNLFVYYFFMQGVYRSIMFNRVNVAKLPLVSEFSNHSLVTPVILWAVVVTVVVLIMLFKPFWIFEKTNRWGVVGLRWNYMNKNLSMILHVYKNAFLGVTQQFTLAESNIKKGNYEKAVANTKTGQQIANDHMALLNKTLSLIGNANFKYRQVEILYCVNRAMQRVVLPEDGSIKMEFQSNVDEIFVFGDERHLTEVFLNLLVNAAEALKGSKKPDMKIRAEIYAERDLVLINVWDNGTGIEKKNRRKIFQPFFSTKASTSGGVGLSYVANVIKQHHGEIRVKSAVGEYTEFQIVLPVHQGRR